MKNLTVYRVTEAEQEKLFAGDGADFAENLFRYMELNGQDVAVALRGKPDPSSPEVKRLAASMAASAEACLAPGRPLVLVFENDMAKVFGMCFLQVSDRRLVSIDGIPVQSADHIDIGRPIVGGLVVPVVIKTLLFGH